MEVDECRKIKVSSKVKGSEENGVHKDRGSTEEDKRVKEIVLGRRIKPEQLGQQPPACRGQSSPGLHPRYLREIAGLFRAREESRRYHYNGERDIEKEKERIRIRLGDLL